MSASHFKRHLLDLDVPFEHITTAAELAHVASDEEEDEERKPRRGLRRLSSRSLEKELRDLDEIDFSRHFAFSSGRQPSGDLQKQLKANFPHSDMTATQQLAIDLSLSRTLVHPEDLKRGSHQQSNGSVDDVEMATDRLSLSNVEQFSILRPGLHTRSSTPDQAGQHESITTARAGLEQPTLHALLDEWVLGSDPAEYRWSPWRAQAGEYRSETSVQPSRPPPSLQAQQALATMPMIPTVASQPEPPMVQVAMAVPALALSHDVPSISTGGRPVRKVVKRRAGGF